MDGIIAIVNWERFQHYGDRRRPPWVRLHRTLLDNREWHELSGDASKLLAECWLLASETLDGTIPLSTADLTWRLRRTDIDLTRTLLQELATAQFIELRQHDASTALATRPQQASPVRARRKHAASPEESREEEDKDVKMAPGACAPSPASTAETDPDDVMPWERPEYLAAHGNGNGNGKPPETPAPVDKRTDAQRLVDAVIAKGLAGVRPADYGKQAARAKALLGKESLEYWLRAVDAMPYLFPYDNRGGSPFDVFAVGRDGSRALAARALRENPPAPPPDPQVQAALARLEAEDRERLAAEEEAGA